MRRIWVFAVLAVALAGCEGTTTVMATQGVTLNVTANTVQVADGVDVDPDTSPVRLWMTAGGLFAFDGEDLNRITGNSRQDLHSTIKERFPNAEIRRIRQMTLNGSTVLFVYIRKPGTND